MTSFVDDHTEFKCVRRHKSLCSLFDGIVSHHDEEVDGEEEVLDRAGHATLHLEVVFEKSVRS